MHGDYLYEDLYLRSWDLAQGIRDLLGKLSQQHTSCHTTCHSLDLALDIRNLLNVHHNTISGYNNSISGVQATRRPRRACVSSAGKLSQLSYKLSLSCLLCSSMSHVMGTWAAWMAGHVAVPLCPSSDQVSCHSCHTSCH